MTNSFIFLVINLVATPEMAMQLRRYQDEAFSAGRSPGVMSARAGARVGEKGNRPARRRKNLHPPTEVPSSWNPL
jgi:hypothetical protein